MSAKPYASHARRYRDAGWPNVLPLPARAKTPPPGPNDEPFHLRFTGAEGVSPADEHIEWWVANRGGGNIALRMAADVVGIDVDDYGNKNGGETLAKLEDDHGPLPATWISTSRDDGVSGIRFYRLPRAHKLIGALPGIEIIQRHHRYAVVAPSVHPDGPTYRWIDPDGAIGDALPVVADLPLLPEAWLEALRADKHTPTERRALATGTDVASPAVDRALGQALRGMHKGTRHDAALAGATTLVRLASQGHPGADGALDDLRRTFLAAVGPERGERQAEAEWGRMVESAEHLVATTPAQTPRWEDLAAERGQPDHHAIGLADVARGVPEDGVEASAPASTGNPELDAPWDEPIPLGEGGEYPEVPIDALPDWMAAQVRNVANQLDCDPMLPFVFGLGALSVASLGHVRLAMRAGQTMDSTGLYLIAAGPKAAGKSPALKMMFGPVYDHQAQRIAACASAVAEAASAKRIAQRKLKEAEERASRLDDELEHATEAKRLALEVEEIKFPPTGEMITTDITPERLATVMAENNERMAIVSDEAGILTVDRYANRGVAKKVDIYLQSFTGEPVAVHRQGAPTIRLDRPLLAIVTGAQPHAVHHALNDPELRERGFSDRFLTASTNVLAGNVDIDHDVWDHEVAKAYDEHLRALADQWGSWGRPATVTLSAEARARYSSWSRETLSMSADPGLDGQDGWLSKARQSVARIAALLHLSEGHAYDVEVARETVDQAIEVGEWFIAHHAREVELPGTEMAAKLLDALVRIATKSEGPAGCRATDLEKGPFVARRELGRSAPVGLRKIDDFTPPLEVLAERGLVRLVGVTGSPNAHFSDQVRRAAGIQVHPSAIARDNARHARQRVGFSPVEDNESAREREGVGEITVSRIRDRDEPLSPWLSVDNPAPDPVPSSTPRDGRDSATPTESHAIPIPATSWDLFGPSEEAG